MIILHQNKAQLIFSCMWQYTMCVATTMRTTCVGNLGWAMGNGWEISTVHLHQVSTMTFNSLNVANYSPYELVFGRRPKLLLDLETNHNIKVSSTFKDYYMLLNKRLQYLHELLQNFKFKRLAMIKRDRGFFQYN